MIEYIKKILIGQFEASLCMINKLVEACPLEHWEGKIANDTFRQVAYHTLYFVDLYLSPGEQAFKPRDFHAQGGDERRPVASLGVSKEQTLAYVTICRQKMIETIAAETIQTLQGPSGFEWIRFSRGELHLYNIRHVQHHVGQMSAYLRRIDPSLKDPKSLPWIGTGWR